MDSVFRALWLATQSVDSLRYSLIHLQFLRASDAKLAKVASKMPSRFAAVINKEISQLIKQAVPQIHEEGGEVRFGSFKALSFWLQFINKTGEKVFCLQIQIKVKSCVTLFSWLVHKKLKTKFNNLFYRMILNTKRIHNSFWRNFPARAKQMLLNVLFVGKKKRRPRPFGHCAPKL